MSGTWIESRLAVNFRDLAFQKIVGERQRESMKDGNSNCSNCGIRSYFG